MRNVSEEKKFSHIAVTSDDDDDFVIEAGTPTVRPAANSAAGSDRAGVASTAEPTRPAQQSAPGPSADATARPQKPRKERDTYHETTLEDIESSKMPAAQKAVIALAVVGILAFVAWYLLR